MKKIRGLYFLGLVAGVAGTLMLVPEVRRAALAAAASIAERTREAWQEGRRAKHRRERELEKQVFGPDREAAEGREAPDYIV